MSLPQTPAPKRRRSEEPSPVKELDDDTPRVQPVTGPPIYPEGALVVTENPSRVRGAVTQSDCQSDCSRIVVGFQSDLSVGFEGIFCSVFGVNSDWKSD